jgi:hypothetical protein
LVNRLLSGAFSRGFCPGHLVEAIALVPINRYVDIIILPEVADGTVVVVASFSVTTSLFKLQGSLYWFFFT